MVGTVHHLAALGDIQITERLGGDTYVQFHLRVVEIDNNQYQFARHVAQEGILLVLVEVLALGVQ